MGADCSNMCVNDEGSRSTKPIQLNSAPKTHVDFSSKDQPALDTNQQYIGARKSNVNPGYLDSTNQTGFGGKSQTTADISSGRDQSNLKIQRNADNTFTYTLDNGAVYRGQMNGNKREGRGTQKWADGNVYEGEWKDDRACGKGKLVHANGDVYDGDWRDDMANGYGIYTHASGSK